MTTITDLSQTLNVWMRRLRLQRAFTWASRGLMLGLALALTLGMLGLYQADLLKREFLALVIFTPLLVCLFAAGIAWFWPISTLKAARFFDRHFGLKERISTALELSQQDGKIPPEIAQRQLQDAVNASQQIQLRRALPFRYNPREGVAALVLVVLIGVLWFRGESWFLRGQQSRAVEQAVAEQATKIEEIIKKVEADEALSEAQKEALTTPLKDALQELQENPSLESSVSVLTNTGEKLQALSDPQAQQTVQALQEAGNLLAGQEGSPLQQAGQDLAQGDYAAAASKLQNINVDELSPAEQQQLADQLEAMADSLQSTNPGLANQLQPAAEALRNGDTAGAQQALNNAAQSLAQTGQQLTFSQAASQTASQMQQGAGQVIAAGGAGQQANQAGQGQQGGQGQSGTQGQGQGQGQSPGQGQGQGSSQNQQSSGAGSSGAGRGSGNGESPTGNEADSSPIEQGNGPGDGGEAAYEQIYAPTLLGGEGGPQVDLPGNGEAGEVIGEGPVTPGDQGTSTVPYNEVYSQYEQINNQAIENSEIPAQFTEIIKNYFDSLKP